LLRRELIVKRWAFPRYSRCGWFQFWAFITGGGRVAGWGGAVWNGLGLAGAGLTADGDRRADHAESSFRGEGAMAGRTGREVKVQPDGEWLVRGAMISRRYVEWGLAASPGWRVAGDW